MDFSTLSVSEQLLYSTVRIECFLQDGATSTGTGFFFAFAKTDTHHVPAIVTNKHVVEGAAKGRFLLHVSGQNGVTEPYTIEFDDFEARWIPHPEDNIDLCVMTIAPLIHAARRQGKEPVLLRLDRTLVPTDQGLAELTAMEDIVMIGYPNGIWDAVHNYPVVRKGITASHPAVDWNGRSEFLIDAACFPGSSGSPVLLFNQGSYSDKKGNLIAGTRVMLLGVLYAGPQHTATGEIKVVNVPTRQQALAISRIPNNLGLIIKAKKLLDFDDVLKPMVGQ